MHCPLCKERALILKCRTAHESLQLDTYCDECEAYIEVTYKEEMELPTKLEGSE